MPELIIERAKGIARKTALSDIDKDFFQELKNVNFNAKPGILTKDGKYSDVSTSLVGADLPSSRVRKSLFELGLTSPANQDIYLCHAKSGSNHEIYVGKHWNGSSFVSSWRNISEVEGAYNTDSSSNANQIIDTQLSNSNDDYYNGWIVAIVISGKLVFAVVTDYTGSSKTLTFTTGALNGNGSGNLYSIYRYHISNGIAGAVIDDTIRWIQRENSVLGMLGNTSVFPTQFNIWYGYVDRTFGITNAEVLTDFYLDLQALLRPDTSAASSNSVGIFQNISSSNSTGSLVNGRSYSVNVAYVYDGFQISPLGAWRSLTLGGSDDTITVVFHIPFLAQYYSADTNFVFAHENSATAKQAQEPAFPGTPGASYAHGLLSKRVTAIRLYLRDNTDNTITFVSEKIIAGQTTAAIDFTMSSEKILTLTTTIESASGNTHLKDIGQQNVWPNFKYGAAISTHFIAASIRNFEGDKKDNNLIASIVDGAGVAALDNFGAANVINLGFFGSKEITGIHVVGDEGMDQSPKAKAMVFADDDYYVLDIVPGASFSHRLDNIGEKEGLHAPDSLVYAEGSLFGISRNGFRIFTVQGSKIIGEQVKDDFDSLTTPQDCIARYHKKKRLIVFHFKTDGKTFAFDTLHGQLGLIEFDYNDSFNWLTSLRNGDLLGITDSKILQFDSGSDQDGTKITPEAKTIKINASQFVPAGVPEDFLRLQYLWLAYQSNTAITVEVFLDGSSTKMTLNNATFAAKTNEGEVYLGFPVGTLCREFEVRILLSSSQKTSNTTFKINRLRVQADIESRLL